MVHITLAIHTVMSRYFKNKNKTEKKLDKEMVEKDQFWYRRGPSDDERLKKYQEELRRKEQLLKNHHIS